MGLDPEQANNECQKYDTQCNTGRFSNEAPVHLVELDPFYMDETEITNAQYLDCVDAGKCSPPQEKKSSTRSGYYGIYAYADYPVIYVNWENASQYCQWRGARLPSEAEWEYAARGGLADKLYPWGDTPPVCKPGVLNGAMFNDKENCKNKDTERVKRYAPNGYGLYDMAGNVWEWVADWYGVDYYRKSPQVNPLGPESGISRVLRGGAWDVVGIYLHAALRHTAGPATVSDKVGFRCARTP